MYMSQRMRLRASLRKALLASASPAPASLIKEGPAGVCVVDSICKTAVHLRADGPAGIVHVCFISLHIFLLWL